MGNDLISREWVRREVSALKSHARSFQQVTYGTGYMCGLAVLEGRLADAPSVDAASAWISVEERLPDGEGKYIVCTAKGSVYCAKFSTRHGPSFHTDMNTHITHWMPLPEPPEEE